ncbi:MAG: cupin domain-containing protein, partial [Gaiellaceae bacterium]
MPDEAPLVDVGSGLAPAGDGWFVVNARDAAWVSNDAFGSRCVFEASPRVVQNLSDVEPRWFPQVGINLDVIMPGEPSGLYHSETAQEDMLVLHGECILLIEGEERPLRAWDFVHCPPGTAHSFVGAGDGPCVIFMVGARTPEKG